MRHLMILMSFILWGSLAFAAEIPDDLVGKYEVTVILDGKDAPTANIVTIKKNGNIILTERSVYGEITCYGKSIIEEDQDGRSLKSKVTCEDSGVVGGGVSYRQEIDLKGINDFDNEFTTLVYTSLVGTSVPMRFKRILKD
ncbi:MAG: hypothetical protein OXB88_08975 [Bacteriovoracales bacterium]|nr:hypothetical protein [Bacteriovoracales bacterium]